MGFLGLPVIAKPGGKVKEWNLFVEIYKTFYDDLTDIQSSLKEDLKNGPNTLSIRTIAGVRRADRSMKRMGKAWKRLKSTIL